MKSPIARPLIVTVFFVVLYKSLTLIPLPLVTMPRDMDVLRGLERVLGSRIPISSILRLGWGPLETAFMLIELCAFIFPYIDKLRHGGVSGRQRLNRYSLRLALILSIIQAYSLSFYFWNNSMSFRGPILIQAGHFLFTLIITFSLVGGVALVWILANAITRFGIGNGFCILFFTGVFGDLVKQFLYSREKLSELFSFSAPDVNVKRFLGGIALAVVTIWLVKFMKSSTVVLAKREDLNEFSLEIPHFPQGIYPLSWVGSILMLPGTLSTFFNFNMGRSLYYGTITYLVLQIVLIVILTWVCFLMFSDYPRIKNNVPMNTSLDKAPMMKTLIYNLKTSLIILCSFIVISYLLPFHISIVGLIIVISIFVDLFDEWNFRKNQLAYETLIDLDNCHLAAYVKGVLSAHQIPHLIQAYRYRRLCYFLQPLVKMRVLVSTAQAEQARQLLTIDKLTIV